MMRPTLAAPEAGGRHAYSPHQRTALVLTGTGSAGAYHAGVLRALDEAGVKLDLVAGRGMGAVSALFAAVAGGSRLWSPQGLWRRAEIADLYPWREALRLVGWLLLAGGLILTVPVIVAAAGLIVYQLALLFEPLGAGAAGRLAGGYVEWVAGAFHPAGLPTWLPRLAFLVLAMIIGVVIVAARRTLLQLPARRRQRDAMWWAVLGAPLSHTRAPGVIRTALWQLISGGASLRQPAGSDLARRYTELLSENLGQPGFRELLFVVHDIDARRDLTFALLAPAHRREFFLRRPVQGGDPRSAEAIDLAGVARDLTLDAIDAALTLPVVADPHLIVFSAESYWRGEAHQVCDRPSSVLRVLEEVANAGVRQVIVATASPELEGPHALSSRRTAPRARLSEFLAAEESASIRDTLHAAAPMFDALFIVRPSHNPVGPLDLAGAFDPRSDRWHSLAEVIEHGYEDAYRQFIDPVVGGSGEALDSVVPQPEFR
jgi:hypothetical protein